MFGPLVDVLASLSKSGGPYLGPKGGLWADPQHTVHWEGHHGAVEVEPHASTRMYPIHLHIEDAGNGEVKISPAKGASGPTIPRESLNHLVNDLRGIVDVPKGHAHPGIAAVARGDARMLGKGDDGVAFKHGDVVVKVSTTVPYQPFNQGHRTPKEAADMLKSQVDVGNHLADLGLPVVRSEFIRHGDKGFQIKPYVDIPPKLSREQLDEVQAALHAMHDKGYAMNDDIQAGELDGKMMFFDVGKAAPAKGEGQQSDKSRDIDRLRMLYQQNGQRFVNSRDPVGKRMWSDAEGAIRGLRQGKGSVEGVKRSVERAADARRKDAHASLSGKELAAELEDIDMDVEWANEDIDGIKGTAKGSLAKGSHVPPEAVRSAARRGLELRKKHGKGGLTTQEAGKQGIGSGVARASNLAAGDAVSTETLRRMVAFFSRHRKNKSGGEDDAGYIAWLLWGGDPGESWAKRELAKVDRVEKGGTLLQPMLDLVEVQQFGWLELPRSYVLALGDVLAKGLSHRYIRRVPTGKTTKTGKPRYRYYYHAAHGGTVGNEDHFVVGASFKDNEGHWHITAREGDKLTLKHDETGAESTMTRGQLREHLTALHKDAIAGAQERARQDIADAKASGASVKQVARLRERAARVGAHEAPSQIDEEEAQDINRRHSPEVAQWLMEELTKIRERVGEDQLTPEGFYARRPLEAEAERQAMAMQRASDRPRNEQRAKALVARVQEHIAAGGTAHIQTMTKLTPLSRPEHASMLSVRGGDVIFTSGGRSVAVVGQALESLARSVGFGMEGASKDQERAARVGVADSDGTNESKSLSVAVTAGSKAGTYHLHQGSKKIASGPKYAMEAMGHWIREHGMNLTTNDRIAVVKPELQAAMAALGRMSSRFHGRLKESLEAGTHTQNPNAVQASVKMVEAASILGRYEDRDDPMFAATDADRKLFADRLAASGIPNVEATAAPATEPKGDAKPAMFSEGSYTSKKGNLKKVAVFTGRVSGDEFKALAATAKEHGGSYIRDAGGFVFMGDAGFASFMEAQGGEPAPAKVEAPASSVAKVEPKAPSAEAQRKAPRIAKWTAPAFGSKPSVDTAEAAKNVRADVKAANKSGALPNGLKLSIRTDRYSMGSTLRISIEDAPFQVLNPEKLEREKNDPYTYNGLNILTPEAAEIQSRLKAIANAYNKNYGDDSDGFRNTRFHVSVDYGTDVTKRDRLAFEAGAKPIASAIAPLRSQVKPEDLAPKNTAAQVTKLRETAAKVRADADAELGKDRNVNTRRRAEMASGIIERAERQGKLADAIGRAADAIEAGDAPALAAMTSKAQAQVLQNVARLAHMKSMSYGEWERSGADAMHPPADVIRYIDRLPGEESSATLARMGVTSVPKLQTAVAEWLRVTDPKGAATSGAAASKRAEIEESNLMRQGITGYFPTPKPLADKMVHAAHIERGMTVLEPSAGSGRLADAAKAAGADVAVVERSSALREHLKGKGYDLAGDDALAHSGKYDRVVMNPPFEGMQDVDHVRHAFDNNLKPGGRLVAIMGEGPFFREDKKAQAFREWLDANGGYSEKLPSGTFESSGTMVSSRMIVVDKPKAEARASAPAQDKPSAIAATPPAQESEQTPIMPSKFDGLMQRADALNAKLDAMTPAPSAPKLTTVATNFADDIPMTLAVSAHSGTSHVPERRGEQEREGYAAHLSNLRGQLAKYETPENREAVEQAFAEYRAGYASRFKASLAAKSRTMSSMITGPARFPVARNQKRLDTEHKRITELRDWSEDQSRKLLKRFNPNVSGPISADRKDAVPAIESEVDKLKARQSMMVAANKVYRSKTLSDDEKVAKLVELGVSLAVARAQLKPDFAGRIGFPDYALVNNSANIRRLESRAESVATEQARATTEHAFDGGRVVDDADANRVRIYHDSKPSADVIAKLKSSGFKWSPSEGAWQRQRNNAARYAAGVITGANIGKGTLSPLLDLLGGA